MAVAKKDIEKVMKALKKRNFDRVEYVETGEAAVKLVLDMIQ